MLLLNTFFSGIANVFITGTFYTGFLTSSGIDIVRVGIITFIPYFAWIFSLFSPKILSHFKKRRGLLLFNHIFYFVCIVLATTLMPMFVKGTAARTLWFGILLLMGHTSNALFGSGSMAWHINFLPEGKDRNVYFSLSNLVSNFVGTAAAIGASVLTDSMAHSPNQGKIIVILRLVSFALFIISGLLLFLIPKEYPYPESHRQYRLRDVFVKPIQSRKFILTAVIAIVWNCVGNFNASTWSYYILNTVGISYALTYLCSVACAIGSVFFLRSWRSLVNRYSWFSILLLTVFNTAMLELFIGFTTSHTLWVFIIVSVLQGLNLVGAQLVFANMFYINLPKADTDIFITFWNFSINIFVLVGSMLGTGFLSLFEKSGGFAEIFGHPVYGSQFLVWIKCICYLLLCVYIRKVTPYIQPDQTN